MKKSRHLGHSWLNSEDEDAGERRKKREKAGSGKEFVGRPRNGEWLGDGKVPVQADGHQYVVGVGQAEGLEKL